jgi:acyl-CoA dehydrogenase
MQALEIEDEEERLKAFDQLLFAHIGHSISNAARSLVLGLSFGGFVAVPGDRKTKAYYRKLSRYSAAFAFMSDITMLTYGGKLKQKEKISGRLADVLGQLYICASMMRRFEHDNRPAADQPILAWAFHDAIYKIQHAMRGVIDNYPIGWARPFLRFVIFPLGRIERAPNDRLGHKVAALMLSPSETRSRLTRGIYKSDRTGQAVGVLEALLPDVIASEPIERKLLKALRLGEIQGYTFDAQLASAREKGLLSEKEADLMADVRRRSLDVVSVDDFDLATLQAGLTRMGDNIRQGNSQQAA